MTNSVEFWLANSETLLTGRDGVVWWPIKTRAIFQPDFSHVQACDCSLVCLLCRFNKRYDVQKAIHSVDTLSQT